MTHPIIIVGAGLAGLACAVQLHRAGMPVRVLDQDTEPGGRVQTDRVNGFLLDRGFQVLNTAYPELQRYQGLLPALKLKPLDTGARIRLGKKRWASFYAPWRHPGDILATLSEGPGYLTDYLRLLRIAADSRQLPADLQRLNDVLTLDTAFPTAQDYLIRQHLSRELLNRFVRPFFGGVLLDDSLSVPTNYFLWLFRLFLEGSVTLPDSGMNALPRWLAGQLPADALDLNTPVRHVGADGVTVASGAFYPARSVVLATDAVTASRLCPDIAVSPQAQGVTCAYVSCAGRLPGDDRPVLYLNGQSDGLIRHICFISRVQPCYAPVGQNLASVTLLGVPDLTEDDMARRVIAELTDWFGARDWQWIKCYRIPYAQPLPMVCRQSAAILPRSTGGVWLAGDWTATPSIQGAMVSGRLAAEQLLQAGT